MTKKSVCHYDILRPENANEFRIARIAFEPGNSLLQPWSNLCVVADQLKHRLHFRVGYAFENRQRLIFPSRICCVQETSIIALQSRGIIARVNPPFGEYQNLLRDVYCLGVDYQIGLYRTDCPEKGI